MNLALDPDPESDSHPLGNYGSRFGSNINWNRNTSSRGTQSNVQTSERGRRTSFRNRCRFRCCRRCRSPSQCSRRRRRAGRPCCRLAARKTLKMNEENKWTFCQNCILNLRSNGHINHTRRISCYHSKTELAKKIYPRLCECIRTQASNAFSQPRSSLFVHLSISNTFCTDRGGRSWKRFCNMFSASSTGSWADLQLPCCPSKQGELPENMLQNLLLNLPP